MARDMETVIRISGNLDASLRRVIEHAAEQIEQIDRAARESADAVDKLSDKIGDQSNELKKAKKQYASYVLSGEECTDQAKALARQIERLSGELHDNQSAMEAAERAADALDNSLDDVGDAVRDTNGGFTIMRGAMANLVSSGIQTLISGCADAVTSVYGLAESTREFRQDMGTLETAFDSAGFTAEQATETWMDLYSLFGEDDRAVEAANNISRIADSQEELEEWTRITTGIWGTYQDALPVENLAEAAAETANTGTVTGGLADALNWSSEAAGMFAQYMSDDVVTAEAAFNEALGECNTVAERQALITETMTALYGDAADSYRETAGSIIEANEANADYSLSMAEMGERIEPVTTAVQEGINSVLTTILDLSEGVDYDAMAERIGGAFEALGDGVEWVSKNGERLLPIVGALIAAFTTYRVISLGAAAAEAIKNAVIASGATTVSAATIATWAFNSAVAFLTSPITIAVAAIAALTAGTIWLYKNWDTAKEKLLEFGAKVGEIWDAIANWITGAIDKIGQYFPVFGAFLSGWWSSIQDAIGNVKAIFGGLIDFISNVFSGNWSAAWDNIVDIFGNIFGMLGNIAKAPINGVISIINKAIDGINSIGFDIPKWLGGGHFGVNIPQIPLLATGGFTEGVSIAGEAGTEAVISFDPAYRDENLSYWAKAGRMLGATTDDAGFELSGNAGGGTVIDMGGVTFSPNINITGKADKESVVKAIKDEYPEFLDMLEQWLYERGLPVYA